MNFLETKIPPPLVGLAFVGISFSLDSLFPSYSIEIPFRDFLAIFFVACGLGFAVAGTVAFRQSKTTINPLSPEKASALVVGGVYQISRNPMYVGLASLLFGWLIFLSSIPAFLSLIGFILYIDRFQIQVEERALTAIFGEEFVKYKNSVRAWL